jgi:hypothetical protein
MPGSKQIEKEGHPKAGADQTRGIEDTHVSKK